jgi:hypothetical protein
MHPRTDKAERIAIAVGNALPDKKAKNALLPSQQPLRLLTGVLEA